MRRSRRVGSFGMLVLGLGALVGCSSVAGDGDESVAEATAALDSTCSAALSAEAFVEPTGVGEALLDGQASCEDGSPLEFKFSVRTPLGRYVTLADYGPSTSFAGPLPAGSKEGTYAFKLDVRRAGTATPIVATASQKLLLGRVCTGATLGFNPAAAAPGAVVQVTPSLQCPAGIVPEWAVSVPKAGGGTRVIGWTTGPSLAWDTAGLAAGKATLTLNVRNAGNAVTDLTTKHTYQLGALCTASALSVTGTGTTRTITAGATCTGNGTAEYRFSVTGPDGVLRELRPFATAPSFAWNVSGLEGSYLVKVEVRAVQTPTQALSVRQVKANIGNACTAVTLADTWGFHPRSLPFVMQASAACSSAQFAFELRRFGTTAWTTVCAYAASATCAVNLANFEVGDYLARVKVRKAGSIVAFDAVSPVRELVVTDGGATVRTLAPASLALTSPVGVSADGRWVVGNGGGGASGLFRWSRTNGVTDLGSLAQANFSFSKQAQAVSADGRVVVGYTLGTHPSQAITEPFRWASRMISLLPNATSSALAFGVSSSGTVVVGSRDVPGGSEAFRWTAATGIVGLGDFPGGQANSSAADVSADGSVVIGAAHSAAGFEAYRWTAATGLVGLGTLPAPVRSSNARSVSANGATIVGTTATNAGNEAFRWTAATGLQSLGDFAGGGAARSFATGVSADGSVVVGAGTTALGQEAFIWTAASGMRRLVDVLAEQGAPVAGWSIVFAADLSSDGKTVVGSAGVPGLGSDVGFLATLR